MEYPLIFLTGFMGSGKTTIGKLLSKKTGIPFTDLDELIEKQEGRSISRIFSEEGEDYFRNAETKTLKSISVLNNHIIATGGGTPAFKDNQQWMNDHGLTIYLQAHPGTILHRLLPVQQDRPLIAELSGTDLFEFIMNTIRVRLPYYVKAKHIISAEGTPESIVDEILKINIQINE